MTKQQKIGATIIVGLLVLGYFFKFYNPVISLILLAAVILSICAELSKKNKQSTSQDVKHYLKSKSVPRKSIEQRRAEYDRDLANRMKARGMAATTPQNSRYAAKYKKLLSMLGGNRETADRLIGRFGIDRAISDLERDRRI